jgi:hypothetical protein
MHANRPAPSVSHTAERAKTNGCKCGCYWWDHRVTIAQEFLELLCDAHSRVCSRIYLTDLTSELEAAQN